MTLLNEWTREEVRARSYRVSVGAEHGTRQHPQVHCGRVWCICDIRPTGTEMVLRLCKWSGITNEDGCGHPTTTNTFASDID
jgi:predicted type IV restriction endonuclease